MLVAKLLPILVLDCFVDEAKLQAFLQAVFGTFDKFITFASLIE